MDRVLVQPFRDLLPGQTVKDVTPAELLRVATQDDEGAMVFSPARRYRALGELTDRGVLSRRLLPMDSTPTVLYRKIE